MSDIPGEPARGSRHGKGLAIVSGGTSGLGAAVAQRLARESYDVVAFSAAPDEAKVPRACVARDAGCLEVMTADVRSSGELNALVTEAVGRFGAVRAVVNNAAVRRSGTAPETSEADWDLTVDTNLKGQFLLAKATIPFMVSGGGGAMVNISSISAFGGGAHVAYAASKAGVLALTRSMAFDHAPHGVRVNAIVAGFIDTPMTAALRTERPELVKALKRTNAARRVLTPVDYAAVVSFLLSDDAELITGAALEVGLIPGAFPDDSYLYPRMTAS